MMENMMPYERPDDDELQARVEALEEALTALLSATADFPVEPTPSRSYGHSYSFNISTRRMLELMDARGKAAAVLAQEPL